MQQRFAGKNVLLTGASSGIGQASAVRFVAEGAQVFGLGRSAEGLEQTKGMVAEPDRFGSHFVDLADGDSIAEAVRIGADHLDGRIDVVCNIAGMTVRTPIDDFDPVVANTLYQVNFLGPLRLISEALPHIPDNSTIVNICSTSATQSVPTLAAYGGSKAALASASFTLAVELAPRRIRVVPISPSGVKTRMMGEIWDQIKDYQGDWFGRLMHLWGQDESGDAEHLAGFIAFAASDEATYWNAAELRIDGGARASF